MKFYEFEIDNRQVCVIDDFYNTESEKQMLYNGVTSLSYKIDSCNYQDVNNINQLRLACNLDPKFNNDIMLFHGARKEIVEKFIPKDDYIISRIYCNLGLVSDYQEAHVDLFGPGEGKTLLIYCNKVWQDNWGGETYFYSQDMTDIKYVSKFVPGRAIIFDSKIPHMAQVQNNFAPSYRFTIAVKFAKTKE